MCSYQAVLLKKMYLIGVLLIFTCLDFIGGYRVSKSDIGCTDETSIEKITNDSAKNVGSRSTTVFPSNTNVSSGERSDITDRDGFTKARRTNDSDVEPPLAEVSSGTYVGYWSRTNAGTRYASFSGIRYTKPMTPDNRFQVSRKPSHNSLTT